MKLGGFLSKDTSLRSEMKYDTETKQKNVFVSHVGFLIFLSTAAQAPKVPRRPKKQRVFKIKKEMTDPVVMLFLYLVRPVAHFVST